MIIARSIAELREAVRNFRLSQPDGKVGFVPTMGALHEGHLALMERCREESAFSIASIFVNPLQFNNPADLEKYPVDTEADLAGCESKGMDLVFLPSREEMFSDGDPALQMSMGGLTETLCGPGRPGHFEGVLFIVARLLNLTGCDVLYLGKKDYQQYMIIQRMVEELCFPVEVVGCETVREEDGLAMSSRNRRLDAKAREHAELIPRALKLAAKTWLERGGDAAEIKEITQDVIESGSMNRVEYVDVVDRRNLAHLEDPASVDGFLIGVGVFCGPVRLIDNIEVDNDEE